MDCLRDLKQRSNEELDGLKDVPGIRAYLAALEAEVQRLGFVEVEYKIIKGRIDALVAQLLNDPLSLSLARPMGSKLVEQRGNGHCQRGSPSRGDVPVEGVKDLHDPLALGRSDAVEVDVKRQAVLNGPGVEVK